MWPYLLLALFLLLLFSPVKINVRYRRRGSNDWLSVKMSFFDGLLPIRLDNTFVSLIRKVICFLVGAEVKVKAGAGNAVAGEMKKFDPAAFFRSLHGLHALFVEYLPFLNYLRHRLRMREFSWQVEIGLPDAAATGLAAGILAGLLGIATGFLYNQLHAVRPPVVKVKPNFNDSVFNVTGTVVLTVRPAQIVIGGLCLVLSFVKNRLSHRVFLLHSKNLQKGREPC